MSINAAGRYLFVARPSSQLTICAIEVYGFEDKPSLPYALFYSGTCHSHGYHPIRSQAQCEEAGQALLLANPYPDRYNGTAPGCSVADPTNLQELHFNPVNPGVPHQCSASNPCLCKGCPAPWAWSWL